MNDCVFCKIVNGEIPSFKILEDDNFFAFLTIKPQVPGHTLVIPKNHVEYIFDMSDELLGKVLKFSKSISHAQKKVFNPKSGKVGVAIVGLEVNHAHIHLIPLDSTADFDTSSAQDATKEELIDAQNKLIEALS